MGLTLITPATEFPVSLAEAKAQVRVRQDDEDALLTRYIAAATRFVEQTLSTSIAQQQWRLTLDAFTDNIELPRGPVISVDAFEYIDPDGLSQDVGEDAYTIDLTSRSPWIVRNSAGAWPATLGGINMVSLTYTAGMEAVPDDLVHAILLLIGHWHSVRETVSVGAAATEVPYAVDALLQPYRWILV